MHKRILNVLFTLVIIMSVLVGYASAAGDASYPEGTIIINVNDSGVPTAASGDGWTYSGNKLTLKKGYTFAVEGNCSVEIVNYGTIVGGTYSGLVSNTGSTKNTNNKGGTINGGTFTGEVKNGHGWNTCTISNGVFRGKVTNVNHAVITGGTFDAEVINNFYCSITGGTFNSTVTNNSGKITGGTFAIEFVLNGGAWNNYTAPTTYTVGSGDALPTAENVYKTSSIFDGWYDNKDFKGSPLTKIPADTSGKLTLYAKFISATAKWELVGNTAESGVDYTVDADGNYTVFTAKGLAYIANIVNGGNSLYGKTVTMAADIDLMTGNVDNYGATTVTETNSWQPINGFFGTFDGGDHKISNLYITAANKSVGLFGSNLGTIKNLEIASGKITVAVSSGSSANIGGIAASTSGLMEGCVNRVNIEVTSSTSKRFGSCIGGVAGQATINFSVQGTNLSTVSNCKNYGNIVATTENALSQIYIGGIAGVNTSAIGGTYSYEGKNTLITRCSNHGTVSTTYGWAGGIVGSVHGGGYTENSQYATVSNCCNSGKVGASYAGGIAGLSEAATFVYNSYNTGSISGGTDAGGIVGNQSSSNTKTDNCYNRGTASGKTNTGGIVGNIFKGSASNCYYQSNGTMTAYGSIGEESATATNCVAFASESGSHTLTTAVYNTTDLLAALKAWVREQNDSAFMTWKADESDSNYPVFAEPQQYTIIFDYNDGETDPTELKTGFNGCLETFPEPTRSGYRFDGWYTDAEDGIEVTTDTVFEENTTVYAHWTRNHSTKYPITIEETENGSVATDRKSASKGTTVTITVTPNRSYTLETLIVTDKNGKEIELTSQDIGGYTFTMPRSQVTVKAVFVPVESNPPFVDVGNDSYYKDAVEWATEEGITEGVGDKLFAPDGTCTRAQAVTFLWRAAGCPAPKRGDMPFVDVPEGIWYYDAVLWATENKITLGTSATTFSPELNCSRAHIVTFLWRAAGMPTETADNPFTDVESDAYYMEAVLWAVKQNITNGMTATTFRPDDDCTRAQIVTFIYRAQNQ